MSKPYFYMKRVALGMTTMVALSLLYDFIDPTLFKFQFTPDQFFFIQLLPTLEVLFWLGLIVLIGAFVAGVRFVIPAIVFFSATTATGFHLLFLIAEPMQQIGYLEIVARNSPSTALGLLVTVFAAEVGTKLAGERRGRLTLAQ
jgi:hypothetical protein